MLQELATMCQSLDFDEKRAKEIAQSINLNQVFVLDRFPTTLLNEAGESQNVAMIKLLLEMGADPNVMFDDTCVLSCLQYAWDNEQPSNYEHLLEITQLLLEYGANPNIVVENEIVFYSVMYGLFNDGFLCEEYWQYISRFYILLVAYGGKDDGYCVPRIVGEFDKVHMEQYQFYFVPKGNDRYGGIIEDGNGNVVAYI